MIDLYRTVQIIFLLVILLVGTIVKSYPQDTIWIEDFTDLADGTTVDSGPTAWTRTISGSEDWFEVRGNLFEGKETDGECAWFSESIDISAYPIVKVRIDLSESGNLTILDSIRAFYSIDGGPETLLTNGIQVGDFGSVVATATSLSGNTIQIIIRVNNDGNNDYHRFDNVLIYKDPDPRYAINDGDWNDPAIWSFTSGGSTCNCIPDILSEVHINEAAGGYTVSLDVDGFTKDLSVYSGGVLRWTSDDVVLQINNGGTLTLQNAASLSENSRSNARIEFVTDGADYNLENAGSFTIDDIDLLNDAGSLTISGPGNITITDTLSITDDNIQITNNNTGTIAIQNDLVFHNNNGLLENYGTISVSDDIVNLNDDNQIINFAAGSFNITDDIDCGTYRFIIDNYGTVDLDGEFTGIEPGEVHFYNWAGAAWNYAGSIADDDDIQLYSNYNANSFEYDGGGNQDVHTPQDAYWHLTLSNSGIKRFIRKMRSYTKSKLVNH